MIILVYDYFLYELLLFMIILVYDYFLYEYLSSR